MTLFCLFYYFVSGGSSFLSVFVSFLLQRWHLWRFSVYRVAILVTLRMSTIYIVQYLVYPRIICSFIPKFQRGCLYAEHSAHSACAAPWLSSLPGRSQQQYLHTLRGGQTSLLVGSSSLEVRMRIGAGLMAIFFHASMIHHSDDIPQFELKTLNRAVRFYCSYNNSIHKIHKTRTKLHKVDSIPPR